MADGDGDSAASTSVLESLPPTITSAADEQSPDGPHLDEAGVDAEQLGSEQEQEAVGDVQLQQLPISKKQQKRLAREAHRQATKLQRRERERAARKEKRAEKRKLVQEEGADPVELGLRKRPKVDRGKRPFDCNVIIDLSFDDKMIDKEIKSMSTQLGHMYSVNRNAVSPVRIICTPLEGKLRHRMDTAGEGHHTRWKGVTFLNQAVNTLWSSQPYPAPAAIDTSDGTLGAEGAATLAATASLPRIDKESVIYLTADSPNVLSELEEGKSYVIGGIVDKNRYKNLCHNLAQEYGVGHAALPISQYIELSTRKVLTVNQCFEIMSLWLEHRDWEKAFYAVIPKRKFGDGKHPSSSKEQADANSGEDAACMSNHAAAGSAARDTGSADDSGTEDPYNSNDPVDGSEARDTGLVNETHIPTRGPHTVTEEK